MAPFPGVMIQVALVLCVQVGASPMAPKSATLSSMRRYLRDKVGVHEHRVYQTASVNGEISTTRASVQTTMCCPG